MSKVKTKNYALLLYMEDETHKNALNYIKENYEYVCITHDRDIDKETGELKKEHVHVVVRFENERFKKPVAKEFGITENRLQRVRNLRGALLYLIHKNDNTKTQYKIENLVGTPKMLEKFEKYNRDAKSETEKIIEIIKYIESRDGMVTARKLTRYCLNNGLWSELRRSYSIIKDIVKEHNDFYFIHDMEGR